MKTEKKYNRSFAARLSRWVMLVVLVMMAGLAYLLFDTVKTSIVEISGNNFHSSMRSSDRAICDVMSDVSVAVRNNIHDIESHLAQPDYMQDVVRRMVSENPRIRSCGISFVDSYYPQKGRWFCPYALHNDSMQVEACLLGSTDNDYLTNQWFQEAVAKDSAAWSKPFFDGEDATTPLVAYMHPVHDSKGRVVAIVGADLSLDFMTRILLEQDSIINNEAWLPSSHDEYLSYVLSNDGTYITHPDERRIQKGNFYVHIKDTDEPGRAAETVANMRKGERSWEETAHPLLVNRKETYLYYTPMTGTDWILTVPAPKSSLDSSGVITGIGIIIIILFVLMVTYLVCYITIRQTAKPLKLLAQTADSVAQGRFDTPLPVIKHRDEICQLRDSFENMQHSLTNYVEELKSTTMAKASIENELKIAHSIQMSMLPKTYPAFPERHDIDIYGQVKPAKAVGGDLYDFFIRDEKLFFCIGDVSGKGVPASLVMAVSRSLFRNIAAHTVEPKQMVKGINESLSQQNDTNMFVTLFVGVLDLQTFTLDYCNAGHDSPAMIADGEVTMLPCDSNIPAGVMSGWEFTRQQTQMTAGSTIFLYTDGLNEAEDISHQQFGMTRVVETAKTTENTPQQLIDSMTEAVRQFVGQAEQSDDLTMLAIKVTNKNA
ncbi:MAG: SpoIIE family protein phosphatase [Prevotella sp.]|nr:SpoIIE family protein phosphatase [Prevotella sp.]